MFSDQRSIFGKIFTAQFDRLIPKIAIAVHRVVVRRQRAVVGFRNLASESAVQHAEELFERSDPSVSDPVIDPASRLRREIVEGVEERIDGCDAVVLGNEKSHSVLVLGFSENLHLDFFVFVVRAGDFSWRRRDAEVGEFSRQPHTGTRKRNDPPLITVCNDCVYHF